MADNRGGEEATSRGNEWEVVTLTSSAYAAAPGPEQHEVNDGKRNTTEKDETMLMSGHFVFPPSQHENLPLEPDEVEVRNIRGAKENFFQSDLDEGDRSNIKDEEKWDTKRLAEPDEFPGIQFFDEKGNIPVHGTESHGGTNVSGIDLVEKEEMLFHSGTTAGGSYTNDEDTVISGSVETSERVLDSEILNLLSNVAADDVYNGSKLPCEAWWKRGAASVYAQVKEVNKFRSIFIAAAVVGIVILGKHLQRQNLLEVLQDRWKLSIDSEKMKKTLAPISRLKALIGGESSRASIVCGVSSASH